jgi:hypothetical protein
MTQQRLLAIQRIEVPARRNRSSGIVHIFDRPGRHKRYSLCGMYAAKLPELGDSFEEVGVKPLGVITCELCLKEFRKRIIGLVDVLACGQPPVTDFATDFEIDAQEAEERGLRWAPVILWALADILREFEK